MLSRLRKQLSTAVVTKAITDNVKSKARVFACSQADKTLQDVLLGLVNGQVPMDDGAKGADGPLFSLRFIPISTPFT